MPFCRRTSTKFKDEWVCADHWRLVNRALKAFRTKRLRQIGRACEKAVAMRKLLQHQMQEGTAVDRPPLSRAWTAEMRLIERWHRVERATWRRMKAQAIERAASTPF